MSNPQPPGSKSFFVPVLLIVLATALVILFFLPSTRAGSSLMGDASLLAPEENKVEQSEAKKEASGTHLESPRATMEYFLESVKTGQQYEASDCFMLPVAAEAQVGKRSVFYLANILDHLGEVDTSKLPDDPDHPKPVTLASCFQGLDREGLAAAKAIRLAKGKDEKWRFDEETEGRLEGLYRQWEDAPLKSTELSSQVTMPESVWLGTLFPAWLQGKKFLLPDYQWICLLIVVFIGFTADVLTRFLLHHATRTWFMVFRGDDEKVIDFKIWRPVGLLVQACVWYMGTSFIGLPAFILQILLVGLKIFAVIAFVWTAFAAINVLALYMEMKAKKTATKFDDLLTPLVTKTLKVMAVLVGMLMCAEVFNLPIAGLIGGLGIGGVALAIASKDAVSNLFGSVTVLLDRPFEIGDWVILPNAEGTVETVGFRSTRIRTFYNSQITVPNCMLTTAIVDNMGRRMKRRVKTTIGVEYNTPPEKIAAFCEGISELIQRHPYSVKEGAMVYFNQFSGSSLDILLYFFVAVPDWDTELKSRHEIFSNIITLAHRMGIGFAFPTRTLHMFQEEHGTPMPGMTPEAGRDLAAEIAAAAAGGTALAPPPPMPDDEPIHRVEPESLDDDDGESGQG